MKKTFVFLGLVILLTSCSNEEKSNADIKIKVIDKIEVKITAGSNPSNTYRTQFSYNSNKEISKLEYYLDNYLQYSYTYDYQNNIPVSSMYDFPGGGDPAYKITYGYTNQKYSSYNDSYYNSTTAFSYNEQFNQYTNADNKNRYILNQYDDITTKTLSTFGNEFAYTFDIAKKGPLYNVKNKKWISLLWNGTANLKTNEISTYPVTSIFDDNLAQVNPFTNIYDAEGFVIKSTFTLNNGIHNYEITYTYILI